MIKYFNGFTTLPQKKKINPTEQLLRRGMCKKQKQYLSVCLCEPPFPLGLLCLPFHFHQCGSGRGHMRSGPERDGRYATGVAVIGGSCQDGAVLRPCEIPAIWIGPHTCQGAYHPVGWHALKLVMRLMCVESLLAPSPQRGQWVTCQRNCNEKEHIQQFKILHFKGSWTLTIWLTLNAARSFFCLASDKKDQ